MTTQKKYHNLVLLDESAEANQPDVIKIISGAFLFVTGIAVGAIFISHLYEDYAASRSGSMATLSSIEHTSDLATQKTAPVELQSITETAVASSLKSSGCSIESLGRNAPETGCSVDDYKEVAADRELGDATGITSLGDLSTSDGGLIKTDAPKDSGTVTNILDLQ
ncbi:MAG TPA: hypothetical protein ENJ51_01165 [Leucothrix mucor]|uniref:Uncharacterized protein n=1 Tax=Leucothrix mucor TaxID=45248 RepID=A0A7V2WTR5_LEUMU|nr:hypothetical protein [Leucothrix mucor]